jgi:hypothetical protein
MIFSILSPAGVHRGICITRPLSSFGRSLSPMPFMHSPKVIERNNVVARQCSAPAPEVRSRCVAFVRTQHGTANRILTKRLAWIPPVKQRARLAVEEERIVNEMAYSLSLACAVDQHCRFFASTWLPETNSMMQAQLRLSKDQLKSKSARRSVKTGTLN